MLGIKLGEDVLFEDGTQTTFRGLMVICAGGTECFGRVKEREQIEGTLCVLMGSKAACERRKFRWRSLGLGAITTSLCKSLGKGRVVGRFTALL